MQNHKVVGRICLFMFMFVVGGGVSLFGMEYQQYYQENVYTDLQSTLTDYNIGYNGLSSQNNVNSNFQGEVFFNIQYGPNKQVYSPLIVDNNLLHEKESECLNVNYVQTPYVQTPTDYYWHPSYKNGDIINNDLSLQNNGNSNLSSKIKKTVEEKRASRAKASRNRRARMKIEKVRMQKENKDLLNFIKLISGESDLKKVKEMVLKLKNGLLELNLMVSDNEPVLSAISRFVVSLKNNANRKSD